TAAVVRSGFTICLTPSWTPVHGGVPISTSGCSVTIWLGLLGASGAPRAGTSQTIDRPIDRIPASSILVMTFPLSHSVRSRDRAHGSTQQLAGLRKSAPACDGPECGKRLIVPAADESHRVATMTSPATLEVTALDHVYVTVTDPDRSTTFYDPVMRLLGF